MKNIQFNKFYKQLNIISLILIVASLILLVFKGLNYGVDFKGGTLIEIRVEQSSSKISSIRDSFNQMNLGDVSVKSKNLVSITYNSMMKAISIIKSGIHLGDIGETIQTHVEKNGFSVHLPGPCSPAKPGFREWRGWYEECGPD